SYYLISTLYSTILSQHARPLPHPPSLPTRRSSDLPLPIPIRPSPSPTTLRAAKLMVRPPLTTLLTRLTPIIFSRIPSSREKMIGDRKSTRLNSSHVSISYAVCCLHKKKEHMNNEYS